MSYQYDLSQRVKAISVFRQSEVQELESGDIVLSITYSNVVNQFICTSTGVVIRNIMKTKVPEHAYPRVVERIAEINTHRTVNTWYFELDYKTGRIAFRAFLHCAVFQPSVEILGSMLMNTSKMYHEFLDQLIDAIGWDADIEAALAGDAEALQRVSDGIKSDPDHYYDSCLRSKARSGVERARDLLNQIKGVEPEAPSSSPSQSNSSGGTGCYIATCVYGSYDCPQVWTLRRFRDQVLARNAMGKAFIRLYYAVSPHIVRIFGRYEPVRALWQHLLDKLVKCLNDKGYDSTSYHD